MASKMLIQDRWEFEDKDQQDKRWIAFRSTSFDVMPLKDIIDPYDDSGRSSDVVNPVRPSSFPS
jgi:hypothetical protein